MHYTAPTDMPIRIDTSAKGYKYMSRTEQAAARDVEWLGTVENEGEIGALGQQGNRYFLFSSGRRPIELNPEDVMEAIRNPGRLVPRGRKPGSRGPTRPTSVTMDSKTREDAHKLGDGNLSLGIRLAVEYVATQVHPAAFKLWCGKQGED